jgi:hypothetical protein
MVRQKGGKTIESLSSRNTSKSNLTRGFDPLPVEVFERQGKDGEERIPVCQKVGEISSSAIR